MKKLFYFGMGLLLCLSAVVFTGCEDKPLDETGGGSGDTTEQRGNLEGVVTDKETGVGIALASVTLQPGDLKALTDKKGAFSFSDIQAGSYKLQVSKKGYADYADDIVVKANGTVRKTVGMNVQGLQILDYDSGLPISELTFDRGRLERWFRLKNVGNSEMRWNISELEEDWITYRASSGKLEPGGDQVRILKIDDALLAFGEDKETTLYIHSTAGDFELKVRSVGTMVKVAAGTFLMGATEEQGDDAKANEKPVHKVTLSGFSICKYEVTMAQWEAVMGARPRIASDNETVECISWSAAVEFCERLSAITGKKFRLPTEAEWEYAARGGQNADGTKYAGSNTIDDVACYESGCVVGYKQPNGLGLYDMSGNAEEWCSDWFGENYYSKSPAANPQGPTSGYKRVCRGGGLWGNARACRVSSRNSREVGDRSFTGLRVVCEL